MGVQLLAIVADGGQGRTYLPADEHQVATALTCALPKSLPTGRMATNALGMRTPLYGLDEWWKHFTPRQLAALDTLSGLLPGIWERVRSDAIKLHFSADGARLRDGGAGASAYADAVTTYLAFVINKCSDRWSTIVPWQSKGESLGDTFGLHALPMRWTFAEANPFSQSTGSYTSMLRRVVEALSRLPSRGTVHITQRDARQHVRDSVGAAISTDPPYYNNVGFAAISDFFYVWLKRNLKSIWPKECATVVTPKAEELVADPARHGSAARAQTFFESGMAEFMAALRNSQPPEVPATIYYAYKTTESADSTGWSSFLQAIVDAGVRVTATWPVRTERAQRVRGLGSNALASSIVLVCRPRMPDAPMGSRGEFMASLRAELPEAVQVLQSGNIAPVDLAQSAIGPGMKVFSRYEKILETDGSVMPVSAALVIINEALGEVLDGEEAELDKDTRFAIAWYEQYCFDPGPSGDADMVARAKDTSVSGLCDSGIGATSQGKFWLFFRDDLEPDWDPSTDDRLTAWESLQHLIATLNDSHSEAADLLYRLGGISESVRQLAYILFRKASDAGWDDEAGVYNDLIGTWSRLRDIGSGDDGQGVLM